MDWIAVALSDDLLPSMAMPGCIAGQDIAIWRGASGQVHAWGDRCPHRGMRLSHGFVRGETLACIYHGWQYDAKGGCDHIPAHPDLVPPKTICATTYSCAEADGVIWVALRPTEAACPSLAGLRGVRSLAIDAPAEQVASHFGQAASAILRLGTPANIALALQPIDKDHCAAHALSDASADRTEISRWLEHQRRVIEGHPA